MTAEEILYNAFEFGKNPDSPTKIQTFIDNLINLGYTKMHAHNAVMDQIFDAQL